MSTTVSAPPHTLPLTHSLDRLRTDPVYQSFTLLRIVFTVAPILFGADKFANILVNWEKYLAPWIRHLSPLSATHTMRIVGVVEILAGLAVAIKPRYGAYIVAAWLGGIIVNLLSYSGYYDIAPRAGGRRYTTGQRRLRGKTGRGLPIWEGDRRCLPTAGLGIACRRGLLGAGDSRSSTARPPPCDVGSDRLRTVVGRR